MLHNGNLWDVTRLVLCL